MSDLAIPGIVGSAGPGDFLEVPSGQAGGSEFSRGEFVTVNTTDGDVELVAGDENDANIWGICEKDERNGEVLTYVGPTLKAPLVAAAATPKLGEVIYLASTTEVSGPTEATGTQKGIGYHLEMDGNGVLFLTHWYKDRTPADA